MAKRYELPDAAWELIVDLVSPEQKMGARRTVRPCAGTQPRRPDYKNPHGLRCQRRTSALCAFARLGQRHLQCSGTPGSGSHPRQTRPTSQALPLAACRQGLDADHLRQYCDRYRMQPVIPLRTMKRKPKPGLPRLLDRPKCRQRNIIERMFG